MAATLAASSAVVAAAPAFTVKSNSLSSNAAQMTFSPLRLAHARVVSSATRRSPVSSKFQMSSSPLDSENVQDNVAKSANGLIGAIGLGSAMSLLAAPSADAAQEIAQLAVDSRPLILLIVLAPALGWVLFNILKPALNQLSRMMGAKSFVGALGLGAAGSMLVAEQADAAQEIAQLAADNRPLVLLVVLGPAIGWVLFNILQPALRQLQNMITEGSTPPKKGRK